VSDGRWGQGDAEKELTMSAELREDHSYVEQYDGHTIVHDRGPTSWGAYVEDLPTCIAVADTFDC